jgi:hypothetical protein
MMCAVLLIFTLANNRSRAAHSVNSRILSHSKLLWLRIQSRLAMTSSSSKSAVHQPIITEPKAGSLQLVRRVEETRTGRKDKDVVATQLVERMRVVAALEDVAVVVITPHPVVEEILWHNRTSPVVPLNNPWRSSSWSQTGVAGA